MRFFVHTYRLLTQTFEIWSENKASRMSAALAYYTILSLAPLLVLTISVVGGIFGEQTAESALLRQIAQLTSVNLANAVEMILNSSITDTSVVGNVISGIILLFGATGVFSQLYDTFNVIWGVPLERRSGVGYFLVQRFNAFVLVVALILLLISLLLLSTLLRYLYSFLPQLQPYFTAGSVAGAVFATLLLWWLSALLFRYLPRTNIAWGDVWLGGLVTAVLFTLARVLITLYLATSSVTTAFGAASSVIVVLVWVYFSGLIIFFGASFCRAYANLFGSRVEEVPSSELEVPS